MKLCAGLAALFFLISCSAQELSAPISLATETVRPTDVIVFGEINADLAHKVAGQIISAEAEPGKAPIILVIDSYGGDLSAGIVIIDAMQLCKNHPVWTLDIGQADSMAAFIFIYGQKRVMWPSATLMLHNPHFQVSGTPEQIQSSMTHDLVKVHEYERNAAGYAMLSIEQYREKANVGWWMYPMEAMKYHFATDIGTLAL